MKKNDIIVILLFITLIGIPIFWIWMLIDAILTKKFKHADKLIWIILLIFIPVLSAIIYYIFEKRKRKRR